MVEHEFFGVGVRICVCVCTRGEKIWGFGTIHGPLENRGFWGFLGGVQKQGFLGVFGWVVFFEVFDGVRFFFCGEKKSLVCVVEFFFVCVCVHRRRGDEVCVVWRVWSV